EFSIYMKGPMSSLAIVLLLSKAGMTSLAIWNISGSNLLFYKLIRKVRKDRTRMGGTSSAYFLPGHLSCYG
ncbi:MAG: hypothetical protein ACWGN2_05055, partial [Anaerolineales bacterium]